MLGLSLLSCGREVTGPADGLWFGRNATAALAIDPRFPQLPGGNFASDLVPFVQVRVIIRNEDNRVVKDTTVDFPSNVDSIALTLTVPLPSSTSAGGVPLTLAMAFVNAAGDTVFRGGPAAIVARPRGAQGVSQPIVIPVSWVPPGAVPASVVLTPTTGSVVSGTSTLFRATAFAASGDSIPNTPIAFTVDTAARATLVTVGGTSTATWLANPGSVRIIASTLNVRADTSFFVVSLPVSTQLAITAAPTTAVAGTTLGAITVAVRDAGNALTPLFTGPVTLTLNAGATGATLAGTATTNAVAGVATFNGLSIQRAATDLTLTATSGALTAATSTAITITPAAPAALVALAGDAQSGTLGQQLTDSVDVQLRDAFANPIGGSAIAFSVTSGGGSISPASVVTGANGRARARWTLGTAVGAQSARAQLAGVPAVFAAFGATGAPGAPVRLEIVTEPAATQVAGAAIAPSIAVRVVDAVGATVTSFTGTVGLALAANPGATTPTGVLAAAAVAGVASFTNVAVPVAAAGYTLAATSGALTPDTTTAFTVLNAAASQMSLVSGGGQSATVGTALAAPLVVRITDAFGNGVPGFSVNWAVTTGAGTLGAASSATTATGTASSTLSVSNTAGAVVVSATASGITGSPQQFAATAVAGAVTQLAYTLSAGSGIAGAPIATGWVIQARDAQANLVTGFSGPVTVVLSNGPGGATLGGTTTVNAVGGIATFANLTVNRIASSWVLIASSPGLTSAASAAFVITPAAPATIAVQAGNAQTAAVLTQVAGQITFRVSDAFGNPTNGTALTVAVTSGGGSVGTASGVTNVTGEFSTTWTLGNTLGGQSVTATVTAAPTLQALATATATPGAAAALVITTGLIGPQVAGVPLQNVVVEARDAAGNRATSFTGTVRALVGGTVPDSAFVTAVAGVATFTGAVFETAGTFFVRFSAPGLTDVVSDTFAVTPAAATQMVLASGAGQSGIAGQLLPLPVVIRIEDPFLNRVPGVTVSWVMFRGADTLAVNTNVSDANGLASWRPTLPTSVTAVQIVARSTGLTNSPITLSAGVTGDVTTQLSMFTQPLGAVAGVTLPSSAVRARDQYGNFKTVFTGNVTAAIDSGPAGAILAGTTTVAAVGGTATFSTLALSVSGTYRLRYSSAGLTNAVSTAFTVTVGTPASIVVVAGGAQSGTVSSLLTDSVAFRVVDAAGNRVPSALIGIAVTTGGGALSTTAGETNAVGEIRTAWTLGAPTGAQSITATVSAVPTLQAVATATATAGAASQLAVTAPAAGAASGAAFVTQPVVAVRDAAGNVVLTNNTSLVTMTVSAGATVVGTATATATAGVATFTNVGLSGLAATYTLTFSSGALTAATPTIALTAGTATQLVVTTAAAGATSGAAFTTQPAVAVRDAAGNVVLTDNTSLVTMTVSAGATVLGTATATAAGGVATFATVGLTGPAATYTLTFSRAGLTAATPTIALTAGAASQLVVTTAAAGAASGAAFTTQPVVAVRDAAGNLVSTSTALVTMSVSAGATVIGAANDTSRATGGVATFSLIGLSGPVGPYTLTFTSGGLTLATQPITIAAPAAQVLSWTGAVSTNWGTAGNWNLNRLPLSTDSVVINGAATVNIASADTVRWLTVAETGSPTLTIAAGATLTVDSLAVFGGTSTVTMTGGTLTGGGSIIVSGIMNWSGGTMAGIGSTLISTVGTLAVTGAPTLNTRSLFIGGTATLGGTAFNAVNTPDVGVLAGGTLSFTSTTSYFSGNGLIALVNAGTLRKAGSAGLVRVDWPITNTGTIEVVDDSLDLRNTLTHAGGTVSILANAALVNGGNTVASAPFTIAAGGVMTLQSGGISADAGNHIFGPTSSVSGLGRLRINSADTTRIQGALNIDSLTVQNGDTWFESADTMFVTRGGYLGGGFVRGTGVLAIRGAFTTSTGNMNGTGTIAVMPTGTLTLQSPLRGWRIDVVGTLVWGDYDLSFEVEPVSGIFANVNIRAGGVFDIQHAAINRELFATGFNPLPNNELTLAVGAVVRKSSGSAISNLRPRVFHSGVFDVLTGTINVQGICSVTGGTKTGPGSLTGNCTP